MLNSRPKTSFTKEFLGYIFRNRSKSFTFSIDCLINILSIYCFYNNIYSMRIKSVYSFCNYFVMKIFVFFKECFSNNFINCTNRISIFIYCSINCNIINVVYKYISCSSRKTRSSSSFSKITNILIKYITESIFEEATNLLKHSGFISIIATPEKTIKPIGCSIKTF